MCGRFTLTVTLEELLMRYYDAKSVTPFHTPRYNIAPTEMVTAVIHDGQTNRIGELRWGLVPSWAKDDKFASKMINARSETITEKPAFKRLVEKKRCIIPASGFYEWRKLESGEKQPYKVTIKEDSVLSLAGLYDSWLAPNGQTIHTCTIITTEANRIMAPIHDRMPVILSRESEQLWLSRDNQDKQQILSLLCPYSSENMVVTTVHKEFFKKNLG
ncbi:SOS response-associated peptidase [Bacillus sp. HMF5848]|nr:SOS response-associated peptidase [Bacillus sp. HMF5848]